MVAVSTCNGINGMIFDGKRTYHIQSSDDGENYTLFAFEPNTITEINPTQRVT